MRPTRDTSLKTGQSSLKAQNARLGWITAGLAFVTVALLVLAVYLVVTDGTGDSSSVAVLPLDAQANEASLALVLAVAAGFTAVFVAMSGLETATAMRVLSRRRRHAPQLPASARILPRLVLGSTEARRLGLDRPPDWEATLLPAPAPVGTRLRCTVLIPAHDEEAVLGATLRSLSSQIRPPDRVVVIADNCSDATVEVARAHGVEVVETIGNTEKKAGALNQELARRLPGSDQRDLVMVMDADSTISPDFLEVAIRLLEEDPDLVAVGGLFYGEKGGGLVGQFQRNEYARYQRVVARRLNRVFVLTGTASVMRAYALQAVAEARGDLIAGVPGTVYDTLALTEDNELTLALKSLGAKMTSPPQCRVTTEVMTTWRSLWRQRLRWHRGALENIGVYGLTRATATYWGQQLALAYGVVALNSYFLLLTITLLAADSVEWSPFWLTIGLVFVVERLVTVWRVGWAGRAVAAPVFLELAYAVFLQACFVTSLVQIVTGRKAGWNYVPRPGVHAAGVAAVITYGIVLPASVLTTDWYHALSLWVAFNTLVFVVLSLLQMLPPVKVTVLRVARHWGSGRQPASR